MHDGGRGRGDVSRPHRRFRAHPTVGDTAGCARSTLPRVIRITRVTRVAPWHQAHTIGRTSSASDDGGHHRLGTEHALESDEGTGGAFGGGAVAAPEAELAAVIGMDLVRRQTQERDAGRDCARHREPTIELPAHPLGEHGRGERTVMPPRTGQVLTVLGLDLDAHACAGQPAPGQTRVQLVGQGLGREGGDVDPFGRRVERGAHLQVGRRHAHRKRPLVEARRQAMGVPAFRPEARHHRGNRQGRQVAQRVDTETA
jgi:hypothetical protein